MRRTTLLGVTIAAALSSRAQGQPVTRDLSHGLHLALEGGLLGYGRARLEREEDDLEAENGVFMLGYPMLVSARVGYLPLPQLEAGGFVSFSHQRQARDEGTATDKFATSSSEVAAYAHYVAPGQRVRPFGGPLFGGSFSRENDPGEGGQSDVETKARALLVGAELGFHGFVADQFSIDPSLVFRYTRGPFEVDNEFYRRKVDLSSWNLTLTIALSGWLFPGR